MEFNFNIENSLQNSHLNNDIYFIEGNNYGKYSSENFKNICYLLDVIGKLSSEVKYNFNFNVLGSEFKFNNY